MALVFPRKTDAWDGFRDAVAFPGEDVDTQQLVACAISHEALTKHFGAVSGDLTSLLMAFRRYRPAIEKVASSKYDATGRPTMVLLLHDEIAALQPAVLPDTPTARPATRG